MWEIRVGQLNFDPQVRANLQAVFSWFGGTPLSNRESVRRFHFLRQIASGGFGNVYLCKEIHADGFSRLVAVKLLKAQWTESQEVVQRIRDEARLLGLIRHKNIVDVMDLTSLDGRTAVIMEYLEGADLLTVIQWMREMDGRVPVQTALEIIASVASALDAAYNRPPFPGEPPLRVIHRDIKPSNIMVDDTGQIKVLDFGVARSEAAGREAETQELQFGSVQYMAPERLFFEPETPASDVYSMAVTLYELLALEKLGKAKTRPSKHGAFMTQRVEDMVAQLDLGGRKVCEEEVAALLVSSLAFSHTDRPSAGQFQQRARALSRMIDDEDLDSWSERVVQSIVSKSTEHPNVRSVLDNSVLTEDSIVFHDPDGVDFDDPFKDVPDRFTTEHTEKDWGSVDPESSIGDHLRLDALANLSRGESPTGEMNRSFSPETGAPAGSSGQGRREAAPLEVDEETLLNGDLSNFGADLMEGTVPDFDMSLDDDEPTSRLGIADVRRPLGGDNQWSDGGSAQESRPQSDYDPEPFQWRSTPEPETSPFKSPTMWMAVGVGCLVAPLLVIAAGIVVVAVLVMNDDFDPNTILAGMEQQTQVPAEVEVRESTKKKKDVEKQKKSSRGKGNTKDASSSQVDDSDGAEQAETSNRRQSEQTVATTDDDTESLSGSENSDTEEAAISRVQLGPKEMLVISRDAGTVKMNVRCQGVKGQEGVRGRGVDRVRLELTDNTSCSVTGMQKDRSRRNAAIEDASPGHYQCFVRGRPRCERLE